MDAYAFPAHKWLLGPEGLGALWLAAGATAAIDLDRLRVTRAAPATGPEGAIDPHPGAARHEVSTPPAALLPAWRASLDWLEGLGWDAIHERIGGRAASGRAALEAIPGVRVLTPAGSAAGLVTFVLAGARSAGGLRRPGRPAA